MIDIKPSLYNDGILSYGTVESQFNASKKKIGEDFTVAGRLHFAIMNIREQDLETANNFGYSIDLKIKVPRNKDLDSKDKILLNDVLYNVKRNEINNKDRFLYLEKVGS